MQVLTNIRLLVTGQTGKKQGDLLEIKNAAIAWDGDTISWVGPEAKLSEELRGAHLHDGRKMLLIPGLVDCHTHLCFAGWRTDEFKEKILGKSYLEIAKAGGGILSTVKLTRDAKKDDLIKRCQGFLNEMVRLGITTLEAKSGYGLDLESEIKVLEVYSELSKRSPVTIVPTFLGAHTIPKEFKDERGKYISLVINEMLPAVAEKKLARFCDIFVEESAFSANEARDILGHAKKLGFGLKLHVDQLSNGEGASLAAELGAVSADHLEFISAQGIEALAKAKVTAVALPIASLYTKQSALNGRRLIEKGIGVAVATDFNPGSAPSFHLPLAMMLSCTMNGLTPAEALNGATLVASKALGLESQIGSLEMGKKADFVLLDVASIDHWMYHFSSNLCRKVYKNGQVIHDSGN